MSAAEPLMKHHSPRGNERPALGKSIRLVELDAEKRARFSANIPLLKRLNKITVMILYWINPKS
jgi:hypothetical protein